MRLREERAPEWRRSRAAKKRHELATSHVLPQAVRVTPYHHDWFSNPSENFYNDSTADLTGEDFGAKIDNLAQVNFMSDIR